MGETHGQVLWRTVHALLGEIRVRFEQPRRGGFYRCEVVGEGLRLLPSTAFRTEWPTQEVTTSPTPVEARGDMIGGWYEIHGADDATGGTGVTFN